MNSKCPATIDDSLEPAGKREHCVLVFIVSGKQSLSIRPRLKLLARSTNFAGAKYKVWV
jgi:hypothetical protein